MAGAAAESVEAPALAEEEEPKIDVKPDIVCVCVCRLDYKINKAFA